MKTQDTKIEFVKMRAENKSYQVIADTLNISKSTCATGEMLGIHTADNLACIFWNDDNSNPSVSGCQCGGHKDCLYQVKLCDFFDG